MSRKEWKTRQRKRTLRKVHNMVLNIVTSCAVCSLMFGIAIIDTDAWQLPFGIIAASLAWLVPFFYVNDQYFTD